MHMTMTDVVPKGPLAPTKRPHVSDLPLAEGQNGLTRSEPSSDMI